LGSGRGQPSKAPESINSVVNGRAKNGGTSTARDYTGRFQCPVLAEHKGAAACPYHLFLRAKVFASFPNV